MDGPLTVKMKRLPGGEGLPLPARMTSQSAGFDLAAAVRSPVVMPPGAIQLVPSGFAMSIPPGFEGQVRPRSGLSTKYGVTLVNPPGTIDADYRGEVTVALINLGRAPFVLERGMRVAQLVIKPVPAVRLEEVDELDETPRGPGGFGHTGE